ncbi:4-(cytidine 5'-diphospho)-2-C-methyl-D-erythritol kinase [Nereida sp. MMG025]|uniref:4-(cytidine 5'-diphospho)-2-C-methyl-D-erythritol kinase n=1 Tax=Nereida sp. MMG025 TaxID=2909981 RepID=UPI001F0250B5|nr:4-(cytidine 5'-diphospho)-2-C-methyl-D-erythritol kinase [Nereida sp. MMG025]MCF6444362.1 4-(cytidine 5'-diphospho)-2-C-methyl-D-erythritol kinase [Nereida sp. MMG025]
MKTFTSLAPAKVNLTLHITGQRPDGYHLLDSLVAFADVGDQVTLRQADQMGLRVSGPRAQGVPNDRRNLMWQAAERAGATVDMELVKTLPAAAGIGGGSSDATAVLRGLSAMGHPPLDARALLELGADFPVCFEARASRMSGIGEVIAPVSLPPLPVLLVNPLVEVPTGAVFSAIKQKTNAPMPVTIPRFSGPVDCAEWLAGQRNDLELAAITIEPLIARALSDLESTRQCCLARMSGSGATCFAIYPDMKAAHFAAYELGAAHTDWWIQPATLT